MARDRKDRTSSWFMIHHGDSLLRLAKISNFVRWQAVQTVLSFPKQIPDGLLDVTFADKSTPDPFLIEIETYPEKDTAQQILRDLAMVVMLRGVIPDIIVIVLRPKGTLSISPEQIAASARGLTELHLRIHVINLWTLPAEELLAANDVGLIPWVPLAKYDGSPESLLRVSQDRIEEQAPEVEKDNLLAATRVMAAEKYNDVQLLNLLGGMHMSLEKVYLESRIVQRLVEQKAEERAQEIALAFKDKLTREAKQEVVREVTRETERLTLRKSIVRLLQNRFGALPKKLHAQIDAIEDQEKLNHLLDLVAECADLKAFRHALDE